MNINTYRKGDNMRAHGDVEFEWVGNILVYRLRGSFNEEGLIRLVQKRKSFFELSPQKQWFRLLHLADDVFSSESVLLMGAAMQQQSKDDGCIDSITVVTGEYLKRIRLHHESSNNLSSTYADSIEEAIATFKKHPAFVVS